MSNKPDLNDFDGGRTASTPNPNKAAYKTRTCPVCGESCKNLPSHLRNNCEENE